MGVGRVGFLRCLLESMSGRSGVFSDHSAHLVDVAYTYGRSVGLAFQVVDDLLDVIGSSTKTGFLLKGHAAFR